MPGRLTLPNIITAGNLTAGFLALVALDGGSALAVLVLVGVAAVCDVLDGVVARRGSKESEFGMNLDSLADVVSFGVVPALALHLGPLRSLSGFGTAACVAFLVAGAWRLARYPLVKESACFVGLPIPLAGLLVMLLVVTAAPAGFTFLLTFALSALMVSTLPCPTVGIAVRWLASPRIGRRRATRVLGQRSPEAAEPSISKAGLGERNGRLAGRPVIRRGENGDRHGRVRPAGTVRRRPR